MHLRRKYIGVPAVLVVFAGACGSPGTQYVTRTEEAALNPDALILAARDATGTRVPLSLARSLDAVLSEARRSIPELASSHASLDYDPYKVQVTIVASAPWHSSWEAGDWKTGVEGIDAVLEPLAPVEVKRFSTSGDQLTYEFTFEKWIRAKAVAYSLYNKNPAISRAAVVSPASAAEGDLIYSVESASGAPQFETNGRIYHRVGTIWKPVEVPTSAR